MRTRAKNWWGIEEGDRAFDWDRPSDVRADRTPAARHGHGGSSDHPETVAPEVEYRMDATPGWPDKEFPWG